MKDLTTESGRRATIEDIEDSFLRSMREAKVELHKDASCYIGKNSIELGVKASGEDARNGRRMAFASSVELYSNKYRKNSMGVVSSSSFTPDNTSAYWRTIHAASILKNWDVVCDIVNRHCKMYSDLSDEIFNVNKRD